MYGDFPIPYDKRKYNGYKTRSKAAAQYLEDNLITPSKQGVIWTAKIRTNNMKLEISAVNVSDNLNEPLYRPIVKFCIPNILPWTTWEPEQLEYSKNAFIAKQYALTKFCAMLMPGAVESLFPNALSEENGIKTII